MRPTDAEIEAWVDNKLIKTAFNRPVAFQLMAEAARWLRDRPKDPQAWLDVMAERNREFMTRPILPTTCPYDNWKPERTIA